MQNSSFHKNSLLFLPLVLVIFLVFFKNDSFANQSIIHVDKKAKLDPNFISEIFDNTYEEPYLEPNMEIFDVMDRPFNLKEFRGNFVILYFWATWCNTCVQEMQSMVRMVEKLEFQEVKDIVILPVSIDFKSNQQITDFYKKNHLTKLRMFKDQNKKLMSELNVTSLPTTYLINKDGYIIQGFEQKITWDDNDLIKKVISIKGPYLKPAEFPAIAITNLEVKKEGDTTAQSNIIPEVQKKKTPTIIN